MVRFLKYMFSRARIAVGALRRDAKPLPERYPQYQIGRGSYGPLNIETFGDRCRLEIGAFCSFGPGAAILLGGEHRTDWITTFPFDRKYLCDSEAPHSSFAKGDVSIGNDVWIGRDVLILSGATIGDGAVIGARSIVRGTIPPYAVCVGSPARVVKYRFEEAEIGELLKMRWWDWPDQQIKDALPALMSGDFGKLREVSSHLGAQTDSARGEGEK